MLDWEESRSRPQAPEKAFLQEKDKLLLRSCAWERVDTSERRLGVPPSPPPPGSEASERRVRKADSSFFSNICLVSWHLDQANFHCLRPCSLFSSPASSFMSWKRGSGIGGCWVRYSSR